MKLSAFTDRKLVNLDVASGTKEEVIGRMTELLSRSKKVTDADAFLQDVLAREELVSTGVGHGVAFPHAKSKAVRDVVFAFGRTTEDVEFGALDGNPVRLVFLIGAPKEQEPSRLYLNLMAHMSFLMKDEGNRERLLSADSVESVLRLFDSVK